MFQANFTHDKYGQAQYLCFVAKDIANGCFSRAGFHVLPYPVKNFRKAVYFPDLGLSAEFWNRIKACPQNDLGDNFPAACVSEVLDKISKHNFPGRQFGKALLKQFFLDCQKFLQVSQSISVSVLVTPFGTVGSFHPYRKNGKWHINVTWRNDLPIEFLFNALLLAIYRLQVGIRGEIDEEAGRQRIVVIEYLSKYTLLRRYRPISIKQEATYKMVSDSSSYLAKLGFPETQLTSLSLLDNLLTPQEKRLYEHLHCQAGRIVSFSEAAEIVWGAAADEKYSLYSLSKLVENMRRKIRSLGINKEIIFTSRKRGYIFNV